MHISARLSRQLTTLAMLAALPLLAACGDDDDDGPRPTVTATRPAATATSTVGLPTSTAVPPTATATLAVPTSTAVPPTATATDVASTATPTDVAATATPTEVDPTATPTGAPPTATPTDAPATATPTEGSATATPTELSATPTETSTPPPTATPTEPPADFRDLSDAGDATFDSGGSVNQVWITAGTTGAKLELVDADSLVVETGTVDSQGALIFRDVPVGTYRVVAGHPGPLSASAPLAVTAVDEPPDQSFYSSQVVAAGYGYITMRDGIRLSINVRLPGPINGGPYPTVIEYSGYDPANPDSPQPSTLITSLMGYAVVGINIRGTGCSGGAFQFFEPLQWTDGYDAVEIIAAQPWVKNNKVGMVGLSYPGIAQLFVARLQPPSLAAVAPLSTISDVGRGTLYPGGILNNGFATDWAEDRRRDAQPFGQGWSKKRRDMGDQVCIDNQALRLQSPDILEMIAENQFYIPEVADPVTPALFVHDITVPLFVGHAWQDEQVGGYMPNMIPNFTGTEKKHFTLVNGGHSEPLMPAIFHRWIEFLSLYVRNEVPVTPGIAAVIADFIGSDIFVAGSLTLPEDRFAGMTYEEALAAFESEQPVRVLFESGAGDPSRPGAPIPAFEYSFDAWPIPETEATAWYLADGGLLATEPSDESGIDSFAYDDSESQRRSLASNNGNDAWLANAPWDWRPLVDGRAVAYASEPLAEDVVMIGTGSADLWVRADTPDVDLQVTLSEIRPDGQETYVQTGWLRASRRVLDEEHSTELRPVATHREADAAPLPEGEFALVRIEIFPFAHAFRAGSRVGLSVSAPGGDRAIWKFNAVEQPATVEILLDGSRLVLPVIPGLDVPTALPACNAVRTQPCREHVVLDNDAQ